MANKNYDRKNFKNSAKNGGGKRKSGPRNKVGEEVSYSGSDYDRNSNHHNDPAWYVRSPQMLVDAASLAYSNPLGVTLPSLFDESVKLGPGNVDEATAKAVPGIMSFRFCSTPGVSQDNSSPINVAARSLYSFVRHANSGHSNYDSPDLMLYVLAVESAYTAWAWMVRAYGTINSYAQSNKYYARAMIEAMGFNFDDLSTHIADFRAYINQFAYKLGSICIPNTMTYLTRHVWMAGRIWVDSPSRKAQTYMYVPESFWYYDETGSEKGGRLVQTDPLYNKTLADVREMCDAMLAAILESEDMMIMSGDILKAFGEDKLQKVSTVAENFFVTPEYAEDVCAQFQNLTAIGVSIDGAMITQDPNTNAILFDPLVDAEVEDASLPRRVFLNMRKDAPTPADNMVATRCTALWSYRNGGKVGLSTLGSDLVNEIFITNMYRIGNDVKPVSYSVSTFQDVGGITEWTDVCRLMNRFADIEKFDWHPLMYITTRDDNDNVYTAGVLGDLDNYTIIGEYELAKMNHTALLSMFGCPTMGAFVL